MALSDLPSDQAWYMHYRTGKHAIFFPKQACIPQQNYDSESIFKLPTTRKLGTWQVYRKVSLITEHKNDF